MEFKAMISLKKKMMICIKGQLTEQQIIGETQVQLNMCLCTDRIQTHTKLEIM